MIRGLWIGNSAVTKDFLTVMYRIKAMGFNAVRMPMSFKARPGASWVGGRAASQQAPRPRAGSRLGGRAAIKLMWDAACRDARSAATLHVRDTQRLQQHAHAHRCPAASCVDVAGCVAGAQNLYGASPWNYRSNCTPSPLNPDVAWSVLQPGESVPSGKAAPTQAHARPAPSLAPDCWEAARPGLAMAPS